MENQADTRVNEEIELCFGLCDAYLTDAVRSKIKGANKTELRKIINNATESLEMAKSYLNEGTPEMMEKYNCLMNRCDNAYVKYIGKDSF